MYGHRRASKEDWSGYDDWNGEKGLRSEGPPHYDLLGRFLHLRLEALLEKAFQKDRYLLVSRINDYFETCKGDFKIEGLEGFFRDTSPELAGELYTRLIVPGPHAFGGTDADAVLPFIRRLPTKTQKAVEDWYLGFEFAVIPKTPRSSRVR